MKSELARRREVRLRLDAKKELDYDDEHDHNKDRQQPQSSKWKSVHMDLAEKRFLVQRRSSFLLTLRLSQLSTLNSQLTFNTAKIISNQAKDKDTRTSM